MCWRMSARVSSTAIRCDSIPRLTDPEFLSEWRDWEGGRLRAAAAGFARCAASRPSERFGAYYQARSLDRLGDYAGARAAYLRAWNRPPGASMPSLNESDRKSVV